MRKIFFMLALMLILLCALASCSESETTEPSLSPSTVDVSEPETSAGAVTSPSDVETTETLLTGTADTVTADEDNSITVTYTRKADSANSLTKTGEGSVSLVSVAKVASGDTIKVTLAENHKYILFSLSTVFKEALMYVPDGVFDLEIPASFTNFWPSNIIPKISVSYPTEEQLSENRNLALNPYDVTAKESSSVFPHVYSNNNYNSAEFGAHCAIDGFISNTAHGNYPYQSWGPDSTVKSTDIFRIDFGRSVTVNELVTYIRADFSSTGTSHDAYFSQYTVKFSDGSELTFNPVKTKDAQTFDLGGKVTSYIEITGFVTDKTASSGWAGFTEVMVNGYDILKND